MNYYHPSQIPVTPKKFVRFDNLRKFKINHDYYTDWFVCILLDGEIRYSIENGGEHTLKSGEALICPPYYNINKTELCPVTVCFMHFTPEKDCPRIPLGAPVIPINERITEDIAIISTCDNGNGYAKILQMDIWYQLCRLYSEPIVSCETDTDEMSFSSLIKYIDSALEYRLTLDTLASRAGYSKSSLISQFRAKTGKTPMQYVTDRRIDLAKRMIMSSRTLREIASRCGFANEFYFSSVFKKQTGMTPSEYRRKFS